MGKLTDAMERAFAAHALNNPPEIMKVMNDNDWELDQDGPITLDEDGNPEPNFIKKLRPEPDGSIQVGDGR